MSCFHLVASQSYNESKHLTSSPSATCSVTKSTSTKESCSSRPVGAAQCSSKKQNCKSSTGSKARSSLIPTIQEDGDFNLHDTSKGSDIDISEEHGESATSDSLRSGSPSRKDTDSSTSENKCESDCSDKSRVTPSDERSNEEASSSIKESDNQSHGSNNSKIKDSLVSSECDSDQKSSFAMPDIFNQIFVALQPDMIVPAVSCNCDLNNFSVNIAQTSFNTVRKTPQKVEQQPTLVATQFQEFLEDLDTDNSSTVFVDMNLPGMATGLSSPDCF